jgi:peptide/nickel transport system substrate-binding protein
MTAPKDEETAVRSSQLTRRTFFAGSLAAAGGVALAAAGCSSASAPGSTAQAVSSKPKRGGTLTVGSLGSTTDALDPNKTTSNMDLQRLFNLYDTLTYFPHGSLTLQYGLAESIELTAGASVATIRLRDGVTFHDGKSLTADDLMFTFRRILEPSDPHAGLLSSVNPNAMTKMDNRTVRLQLNFPDSVFPERFYIDQMSIVPTTFDPAKPVGTGPFMFKSFVPGQRSEFVRNPNYWVSGQPYLDELVIIDMADPTSQINALLSGQVDAIDGVPLNETSVIRQRSDLKLLTANGGYFQPIVMRVDQAPFNDVRVRQAFRLMANRNQQVALPYDGYGAIGNDMPAMSDPGYPHSLPQRQQDIAQARSLLRAAGQQNLTVKMVTANEDYGLIPGAQVFAQDAKAAGVTVNLDVVPASVWNPQFTKLPFTQGYWGNKPFGIMWALLYAPGGIFNETHFNDPQANGIFADALKDTNTSTRTEKFRALEQILYTRGGHIIHSFRTTVDAHSAKFAGFTPDKATGWSLGQYRYREVWAV